MVVRTKDRPDLLSRAFRSILHQTYNDWECIVVNDGGDPAVLEGVLTSVQMDMDERVKIIRNEESLGRWPAANAGIRQSAGTYVALHDDDDSWHPRFLEATVGFLDVNCDELGVIARAEVIHEALRGTEVVEEGRYILEEHNPEVLLVDLLHFNRFVPIQFLYRRSLHDQFGLYDERLPAAADWAFNLLVCSAKSIRYVSGEVLAYWHQRPSETGPEGNSVFAATDDHERADRAFRDEQLRAFIATHGAGLPLILASQKDAITLRAEQTDARQDRHTETLLAAIREQQARLEQLSTSVDRIQHHLDRMLDTRIRGFLWRQKQRLKQRRFRL
ncbi:glycosyltransferase family 2 protein [Microbacterium kunmingense]|uniref:glycosyltransferase family 2 protein n=1 Tax=Microbacterium kunmingense TaxID=2915939 RepID=UPI0027E28D8E|nr:glycosyltransferase [Microbacterium kunmingense]